MSQDSNKKDKQPSSKAKQQMFYNFYFEVSSVDTWLGGYRPSPPLHQVSLTT